MKWIDVGAAIIENEAGEILIARRKPGKSQAGLWEFPGGKIESGESIVACIRRELMEELQIDVDIGSYFGTHEHQYETANIRLIAYKVSYLQGEIRLIDHDAYCWVRREVLHTIAFAPADVQFVQMLQEELEEK
ncbi:8-oxo-dGTP diphosphatase MutT [Paenibacillus guangzhouensis]|uniref:8-oxo-dGTP diphosphatase MutT n=1 Tax=Paenibacillus guangzhouensis TaxID=1473112 RepID=UPI001D111F39|nr:8-oxo-dGTP diphosphatase MutT [Paenibacillus guangzhouensis]